MYSIKYNNIYNLITNENDLLLRLTFDGLIGLFIRKLNIMYLCMFRN